MKAQLIKSQPPGGQRTKLSDIIPLATPLVVQFQPTIHCNFACIYCSCSLEPSRRPFVSRKPYMPFDIYKKGIDDLLSFPNRIKTLRLAGLGEHLLHKQITDMIAYATLKQVAERTEISTNGILLTHNLSAALIEGGLSRLVISIQGTTARKYQAICGRTINMETFIDNIRYFYEHKTKTHVHIKIVDVALDGKEDEELFYNLFGDVCDSIGVEFAVPIHPNLPLNDVLQNQKLTQYGIGVTNDDVICPLPFYLIHIVPDGEVMPCCAFEFPGSVGNIEQQSIEDIWNGRTMNMFRYKMLNGHTSACDVCRRCNLNKYRLFPEDILDNDKASLKIIYSEVLECLPK